MIMQDNYNTRLKNSLMVATFLGGISFGAVTFLIGLDTTKIPNQTNHATSSLTIIAYPIPTIVYKQFLIGGIGIASTLLIVSVFFIKAIIVQNKGESDILSKIALGFYEAGFAVLLIFIPFIVAPFSSPEMGSIIIAIEIIWAGLWIRNWMRKRK
jgi:hypothetical protein